MAIVTIKSVGVGVIYKKDDMWKILYPIADGHNVKISYKKGEDPNFKDLGSFGKPSMRLELKTSKQNQNAEEGNNFGTLFNMTRQEAHSSGLKLKDDWNQHGVLFEVHNAKVNVIPTKGTYELEKASVFSELGNIGFSMEAVIDLEDKDEFSLSSNGTDILKSEKGVNYEISIDNNCTTQTQQLEAQALDFQSKIADIDKISDFFKIVENQTQEANTTDFTLVYDMLEDLQDKNIKVSVIRNRSLNNNIVSVIKSIVLANVANIANVPNVVNVMDTRNLVDGEPGKPCHLCHISNINDTFV
jgi:hypothetical protein